MALTQSIINPIVPFDATQSYTVTFNVIGGDQVVANRIKIWNSVTGVLVYDNQVTSFSYSHIIPANTLTNGVQYMVGIYTINSQGQLMGSSNSPEFYCFTNSVVTPTNFSSGATINNAKYTFQMQYTQAQSEPLQSYTITLYSASDVVISSSGTVYAASSTVPFNILYSFSGMSNATIYKVGMTGVTLHGMSVIMTPVQFTVNYETPSAYSLINLTNNCDGGYVTIQSNIQNINGTSQPSPPTYIGGEAVDLTANGSYVDWNSGYNINGDFTIDLWVKNPTANSVLFTQQNINGNNKIEIRYNVGYAKGNTVLQGYFDLKVISGSSTQYYYNFSNYIPQPAASNMLHLFIRRINNIYTITAENLGG